MKTCKSCKKEIDASAKKCPYCQTDLRVWFARHPILTVLILFILFGVVSGGNSGSTPAGSPSPSSSSSTETDKESVATRAIGEAFNTGKMEFTLTSVESVNSVGSQYLSEKASEGATLIVVRYKYKNTSDKPLPAYTQPTIKLVDNNKTEYDPDLGKTSTFKVQAKIDEKFLSDLNPGITVNGAEVFEVSKDSYSSGNWQVKISAEGNAYYVKTK